MQNSFVTISVATYPYSFLKPEKDQPTNSTLAYLRKKIQSHLLDEEIKVVSLGDNPILKDYNLYIQNKYGSRAETFAVHVQGLHTLILTLLVLDENGLKGKLEGLWVDNYSKLQEVKIGEHLPHWAFSFSIFTKELIPNGTTSELFSSLMLNEDDFQGKNIRNGNYLGWCNWDGGFLITKNDEDVNRIVICLLYQFIKWESTENCHRVLMTSINDLSKKESLSKIIVEERIVNIMQRMLYLNSRLQKDLVSYDKDDIAVHDLLERGWEFEGLYSKAMSLFTNTKEILNLSQGIELKKLSSRTNKFLSYIGIVGFSGTIAAIISTTDFSNSILSSPIIRFSIIAMLTAAILISFKRLMDRK